MGRPLGPLPRRAPDRTRGLPTAGRPRGRAALRGSGRHAGTGGGDWRVLSRPAALDTDTCQSLTLLASPPCCTAPSATWPQRLVGEAQASGRVEVRRPCWVGSMAHSEAGWRLAGRGRDQGTFAAVAIAHNGKCANRLLSGTGADDVERQMRSLRLSSIWALMVAFDAGELCRAAPAVAAGMEGAFIGCAGLEGSSLAWVANNTAKLGTRQGRVQCWTLLSTDAFGKAIKVPQESVPAEAAEKGEGARGGRCEERRWARDAIEGQSVAAGGAAMCWCCCVLCAVTRLC